MKLRSLGLNVVHPLYLIWIQEYEHHFAHEIIKPNYWCYLHLKAGMHHTNTYSGMTQMLWPSTLLFWYCKPPLSGWSTTLGTQLCFKKKKKKVRRLRDSGQVWTRRSESETHWPQITERRAPVVLSWSKPVKSSCLRNLFSFVVYRMLISSSYHTPHSYSHVHSVYMTCTHELLLLPLLDCTTDPLSYNYHDIYTKATQGLSLLQCNK